MFYKCYRFIPENCSRTALEPEYNTSRTAIDVLEHICFIINRDTEKVTENRIRFCRIINQAGG